MHVHVATSLDLNWLLGLLGLAEKKTDISDHSNTDESFSPLFIFLTIVIGLVLLQLLRGEDNREPKESEQPTSELDDDLDGDGHLCRRTATHLGGARRRIACAFCGNPSTTRCSRCKDARYCSVQCQIRHWRSGHKYECFQTETEADEARNVLDNGTSMLVGNYDKESIPNRSHGDEVDASSGSDVNNFHSCEECGSPVGTTRCSRCKAVRYCSAKCLIMNWRWHKDHCDAGDVNSAPTERPNRDVGLLKNSCKEEENIHHSEGTSNLESQVNGSQESTKESQVQRAERVKYLEDELIKSRKEILLLQSESDEWKKRANFARERFQSLKKESEHQLSVLRNEKESISIAEKKASNVIRSLHERLNHLQIAVQESNAEKKRLEEHIQIVESKCAKLKKELQEEHRRAQYLTLESNKSNETAQIAVKEAEAARQELQEERKHVRRLKENFQRDVTCAKSRAAFAEAKLSDLHSKIRLTDYKVPVVTDNFGRPTMVCTICLTNEKDLAFGCGHMTCRDCGSKLSKCPICREQITSQIRLFPG